VGSSLRSAQNMQLIAKIAVCLLSLSVHIPVSSALETSSVESQLKVELVLSDSLSGVQETTKNKKESLVSVESTSQTASDVRTNKPNSSDNTDTSKSISKDYSSSSDIVTETSHVSDGKMSSTLSPTLSAESLLNEDIASETINLGKMSVGDVSDNVLQSSQQTSFVSSSSSTPSIVISIPSMSSSESSISTSSILPSAPTTSAPEEIVTTNPLPDEEMDLYQVVTLSLSPGDVRAGQPSTVKIVPSSSTSKMEMTTPVYHRANPNRMGLLDGETEDDEDHFLSHKAPQKSVSRGGPLNQARSSATAGLDKNNRRADPGPDISDILSGLLNVVGEGLSIATNYVQENNKKKFQEKNSGEYLEDEEKPNSSIEVEDDSDFKRNISRINNRGPPLLSNIPFEAIPLEVLSQQRPGARPGVAIPQRPFQTHLPPGISGPPPPNQPPTNPTLTSPSKNSGPPFKSGVQLPERLIPTKPGPVTTSGTDNDQGESGAGVPGQLPTRPGYTPEFSLFPNTAADNKQKLGNDDETDTKLPTAKPTSAAKTTTSRINKIKKSPTPAIKPVSTDPFIDLLLNEIKEGRITTNPPTTVSPVTPPVELEPSFTPPLLVTPPSTSRPRNKYPPPPRPPQRPWPGGRPPRPKGPPQKYPEWKYQNKPSSSYPTPPLKKIESKKPLVFPTNRYRGPQGNGVIVTGVAIPADNDVFDLTVTAAQNFGGSRKTKNKFHDIITRARPGDQFVSIDGKRTYFDVGPTEAPFNPPSNPTPAGKGSVRGATKYLGGQEVFQPTKSSKYGQIVGSPLPVEKVDIDRNVQPQPYVPIAKRKKPVSGPVSTKSSSSSTKAAKPVPTTRLPPAPPVRIDTCIVGNDKTCGDHEICKTYLGVSSCYCKPGYGRKSHRLLCKKTVRLLMSMKIDRVKDDKLSWSEMYVDQNTAQYQNLEDEVNYAIGSAMALTSFSNIYMGTKVNKFFSLNGAVTVNTTLEMEENSYTRSELVKRDIKNKLIEVIQARANNIGSGNLYVSGPFNPIPGVEDFNECSEPEYNDCGDYSVCVNQFGGFTCECLGGYGDKYKNDPLQAGRHCESCPAEFCSNKGQCAIDDGIRTCTCTGNFYGDQCQIDGEVLAVAIGASVAAVIIIFLTLICLCMWSRRWKREQQKTDLSHNYPRSYMVGTLPPPGYMTKMANWQPQPSPIYTVDNSAQLRWAHHLDANGQNIYAQPVVYSGVGPHVYNGESLYMAPPEPPRSIYGTLPRSAGNMVHAISESSLPVSSHYATYRREKLGPKVSLKLKQMMKNDKVESQDTMSIMSGFTESSGADRTGPKDRKQLSEVLYRRPGDTRDRGSTDAADSGNEIITEKVSDELPDPASRRGLAVSGGRMGPLPSIPRPSTALGAPRVTQAPLIETSESEDTEPSGPGQRRPRSSSSILAASNLTLNEEYDTEYLRYGGTVGVRNPRLVAQMRGVPTAQQQQHIQMNMMGRGW